MLDAATAPRLVVQPADHRAAHVRVAVQLVAGPSRDLLDKLFDPTHDDRRPGVDPRILGRPLIIKGIQTVEDARRVIDAGADAVVLSNHGGRQLDRAPVPLRLLPDVAEAVGDRAEVWVDTGIMTGADIVAAIALGRGRDPGRPRLPVRSDGRRRARRRPGRRDPLRRDPAHHAAARGVPRRRPEPAHVRLP